MTSNNWEEAVGQILDGIIASEDSEIFREVGPEWL